MYKLGKLPAKKGAVKLKLSKYLTAELPEPPEEFGDEYLIKHWPALGNNRYGNCVIASKGHIIPMWCAEGGKEVKFSTKNVLADYSAITGFNPCDPSTDNGTYMSDAAKYFYKTGYADAKNERHKIDAYLSITPGDVHEHRIALYLFGAVDIGFSVPAYCMRQFALGQVWDVCDTNDNIQGGHCVPLVARRNGMFTCATWGKLQQMTDEFLEKYEDEAIVYLSPEMFGEDKITNEGFDYEQLKADLEALK